MIIVCCLLAVIGTMIVHCTIRLVMVVIETQPRPRGKMWDARHRLLCVMNVLEAEGFAFIAIIADIQKGVLLQQAMYIAVLKTKWSSSQV